MKADLKSVLCAVGISVLTVGAANADCRSEYYGNFVHRPGHKAMAITGGRSPSALSISCGTSLNKRTVASAKLDALRQCRVSDRKYHDLGKCKIVYAK